MIETLISILILLIVFGIVFWLLQQIPLPAPWGQGVQIVAILICLLLVLSVVFGGVDLPRMRSFR